MVVNSCSRHQNKSFMLKKASRMNQAAARIAGEPVNNSAMDLVDAPAPGKIALCSTPYVQPVGNKLLFLLSLLATDRFIAGNASRRARTVVVTATDKSISEENKNADNR